MWEFPILTLKYGGVVFILVYLIMFLLLGSPMLLLEMTLGQYSALTPTRLFRNLCPVIEQIYYIIKTTCVRAATLLLSRAPVCNGVEPNICLFHA